MYDTLMQMGRWFGYREKYIDVCRLYTTKELLEWFTHIAAASEELQREFEYMVAVGGTPRDYGLKVRSHPALLVTSAVKMRHGTEMRLSYSGERSQTIIFSRDSASVKRNFETTSDWLASLLHLSAESSFENGYTWRDVPVSEVITFLRQYEFHDASKRMSGDMLTRYIEKQNVNNELVSWTVHLVSNSQDKKPESIGKLKVGLNTRSPKPPVEMQIQGRYTIGVLTDPKDEMVDLSPEQKNWAYELTRERWIKESRQGLPNLPGGKEIRVARDKSKGLLLLYPIKPDTGAFPADTKPIIGVAISFPKGEKVEEVTYTVNNVFTSKGGDDDSL
jgi:hypothetical protein